MAKKKTTTKEEETPLFNLSDIAEGTEQITEVDKKSIESEKTPTKPTKKDSNKKPTKKKPKMGRPKNPDPIEIHKFLLRLPKEVVEKLDADLETDKITGRKESRNNYILRAILLQLKRKK